MTKKNKALVAIGNDMRNLAVICLGAGVFEATLRNDQNTNKVLVILLACSFVIWACGIVLTTITQK